jgi:hypothetical protein
MKADLWKEALLPSPNADQLWELFHENSKIGRYNYPPPDEVVLTAMVSMYQSLPFATYPAVELPTQRSPLCLSLAEAITSRATARNLASLPLSLADLAALLYYAYGVTRDNVGTNFSRPFRVVPSAGALYPLELFFDTASVEGLESGLYHYNPLDNVVRRIRHGDNRKLIQEILVQGDVAADSSLHCCPS